MKRNVAAAYAAAKRFILRDLWSLESVALGRWQRFGVHWMRTLSLAVHGFVVDKCMLRAAALTFAFIFSLAPTLAVGFSVAKGFGAQSAIRDRLPEWLLLATHLDATSSKWILDVLTQMLNYIDNTNVGALGIAGFLLLFYTAYNLLTLMERTMNEIWGVRRQRRLLRKVVDYTAVIFVVSLMLTLMAVVMASVRIAPVVESFRQSESLVLRALAMVIGHKVLSRLVGGLMIIAFSAAGFWFLYCFFPNTRVPFKSAAVGAVTAALAWQVFQWAFVYLQVGVSRANAVYGTFAALPIFLLWLQSTWVVVLFGAELSYAHANQKDLEFGGISFRPSPRYEEQLALGAMTLTAQAFARETPPLTGQDLAHRLGAPVRVMREVLAKLTTAGLLAEVINTEGTRFIPAAPLEHISLGRIVAAVHDAGDVSPVTETVLRQLGVAPFLDAANPSQNSPASLTLKDLVESPRKPA